jgi:hypothetical protein
VPIPCFCTYHESSSSFIETQENGEGKLQHDRSRIRKETLQLE